MLTRKQWGATAKVGPFMTLPARGVFIHHSVTPSNEPLVHAMRRIERIGVQSFGRFSYSVCSHRSEGQAEGAGVTIGAHTGGFAADGAQWNRVAVGYCFIGNYDNDHLTGQQVRDFGNWCQEMVVMGLLVPDFFISPHRKVKNTACPGHNVILQWDALNFAARGDSSQGGGDMTIDVGSRGQAVEDLQGFLWVWIDPTIVIDGVFGPATAEASKKLKAIIRRGSTRPDWVNTNTPAWSHRTFAVYAEWEEKMRAWLRA